MKVLEVMVAPEGVYCDGDRGYWLNGVNIALNAEAYQVCNIKLFDIFNLDVRDSYNPENERIYNQLGERFETIEEFLEVEYNLKNLEQETYIIIKFEN